MVLGKGADASQWTDSIKVAHKNLGRPVSKPGSWQLGAGSVLTYFYNRIAEQLLFSPA